MEDFSLQNTIFDALIQYQNPLIRLYLMKKSIERELIREIQINSYLQSLTIGKEVKIEKFQPKTTQDHKHIERTKRRTRISSKNRRKNLIRKMKNDTKNIPKNFGKAIITFVEQNEQVIKRFLSTHGITFEIFSQALKQKKRGINSIADLRNLWLEQHFIYARQMRMISLYFLKRGSLSYVFSSRITNHEGHIKYRNRLIQVLRFPEQFTSIKTG